MREFRADIGGAQLTSKTKMINALKALERQVAAPLPDQMLAFGISNKGQSSTLKKLFSTHPPLRKRIEALENSDIESVPQEQLNKWSIIHFSEMATKFLLIINPM